MESLAVFVDEEWDNLSRMFSSEEDYSDQHFALQLHGHGLLPSSERDHDMVVNIDTSPIATFWPNYESSDASAAPVFDEGYFLNYYFSQENSNSSGTTSSTNISLSLIPTPTHHDIDNYHHSMPNNYSDQSSMDFCAMDDKISNNLLSQVFSDDVMEDILCLKRDKGKMESLDGQHMVVAHPGKEMQLKRKFEMQELPEAAKEEVIKIDNSPKKKLRVSKDNKNKKTAQSKKNQKAGAGAGAVTNGNEGEEANNNGGGNGQSSSSYCSEDDSNSNSNGSQESNGGALNLNGKTRASRGAATDPQSLYARKRRERINERLRILQNLVPNGTKVDISTMLEEAVHYVKFLQLQIKLLSSDDMWMYAPIAYNGMDMGLYQNISVTQ